MKSDKEFIDGIYEKAKYYKEDITKKKSKSNFYLKPALALAMACCAIVLITINPALKKKEFNHDLVNQNKTRNIIPSSYVASNPLVLAGTISDINEGDKTFVIYNITSYSESLKEGQELIVAFDGSDFDDMDQYKDNKVLVYVNQVDNEFILENGIRSIYILVESGTEYELYKGVDGLTIDTRTLKH